MCEAYGGGIACDGDPEDVVSWMCSTEYTTTFVSGGCEGTPTQVLENYGWGTPMTQAQSWSFNARPLEEVGYIPPVVTYPDSTPGSPCLNGLVVMQAHVSDTDNGCRPPHCDFGRATNGWCEHPTSSDQPIIYVTGPSTIDEDGGTARFRVALSHASTQPVSVAVQTVDGTARSGSDYTAVSRTVTIPANRATSTVIVPVLDDSTYEPDEDFMLQLSTPSNGDLSSTPQADATIQDDDPVPVLVSITGNPSVEEGGRLSFRVTPNQAPPTAMSVRFRAESPYYSGHPLYVEDGWYCGQSPTTDYIEPDNTLLEWDAGDSNAKTVSITTCNDRVDEQDKTLTVELHTPLGAAISTGSASGTIRDNDDPSPYPTVTDPTFFIDNPTVTEGDDLEFTVTLMPVGAFWSGTLEVTLSGTATLSPRSEECGTSGDDANISRRHSNAQNTYSRFSSRWQGGSTTRVTVETCDDTTPEDLETLTATLSTEGFRRADADVGQPGTGTILDNDTPEVSLTGPVSATEGTALVFTVELQETSPEDVTVTLSTGPDPAATHSADGAGSQRDYVPWTASQVTIPAGSLSTTVSVFTVSDSADEHDETFLLRITSADSPIGAAVGSPSEAVGTISDDDNPPTVSFYNDVSANEDSNLTFEVVLSAASGKTVTVTASTASSSPVSAVGVTSCSADDGTEDFENETETITFQAGETYQTFIGSTRLMGQAA